MEDCLKKIKEKIDWKSLIFFSIITLMFFGIFCRLQYSVDTYVVFTDTLKNRIVHFCSCGRFISALYIFFIKEICNIGNRGMYNISFILSIFFLICSLYKLNNIIKRDIVQNNFLAYIVSVLILINPFTIEMYFYVEKGIMVLSIYMCICAVNTFIKYLKDKDKNNLFKSGLFMFLANCSYQGTVGIFVAISLVYIIKYSNSIWNFIINNISAVIVYRNSSYS